MDGASRETGRPGAPAIARDVQWMAHDHREDQDQEGCIGFYRHAQIGHILMGDYGERIVSIKIEPFNNAKTASQRG